MSITITKKYKAVEGKAPFVYTWQTNNSCVQISMANGSFTSEFETSFTFLDAACIAAANIQLNITDSQGCSYSQQVTFANPCDAFVVEDIANVSDSTYNIYANQVSTYEWQYDALLFNAQINGATIVLTPKYTTTPVAPSILSCVATNAYGCSTLKSYEIVFEQVKVYNVGVSSETSCATQETSVYVELSGSTGIDWNTLEISFPEDVSLTNRVGNKIYLQAFNYPKGGRDIQTLYIRFKAKNTSGIYSNEGRIVWNISKCSSDEDVFIYSPNINATDIAIGTIIEIPIYRSPDVYVNKLIATGSQTQVSDRVITTAFGTITLYDNKITYQITSTPTVDSEVIQFTGVDANGVTTKVVQTLVSFNTIQGPQLPLTPFTLCTDCGGQTPFIDFSKYINDIVNPRSLRITTQPTSGRLVLSTTGNVSYIGNNVDTTGDYFEFDIENKNGVRSSNTARVNIENRCSGIVDNVITNITCYPKVFDLESLLTGFVSSQRLWTDYDGKYTAAGGTITNTTTTGTVNFTNIPVGNYKFKLSSTFTNSADSINCGTSQSTIVEVYIGAQPDVSVLSYEASVGTVYRVYFTATAVSDPANIAVTVNGGAANFVTLPSITGTNIEFYVELPSGSNSISVAVTNDCGATITRTTTIDTAVLP